MFVVKFGELLVHVLKLGQIGDQDVERVVSGLDVDLTYGEGKCLEGIAPLEKRWEQIVS
jgi:hypothetical protein